MKHYELKGRIREVGRKSRLNAFRRDGLVPCNLYGKGIANVIFTVEAKSLKGLTHTPAQYIVDIKLDNDESYRAILHETQWHPVDDTCLHADFLAVNEEQPVTMKIPVVLEGRAKGTLEGGVLLQYEHYIRVSALMKYLPDNVTLDVTPLLIGDQIVAGDVNVENVTILTPEEKTLCIVRSARQLMAEMEAMGGLDEEEEGEEETAEGVEGEEGDESEENAESEENTEETTTEQ